MGEALEGLYEGRLEEAAVPLARHFAGDPERERRYARMAGERAAAQFANEEAVRYLGRALVLMPAGDQQARYELLLAREGQSKLDAVTFRWPARPCVHMSAV